MMTYDEGRALDCEVAERVLGWEPIDPPSKHESKRFRDRYWKTYQYYRCLPADHLFGGLMKPVPHCSATMDDAWLVVQAMERRGFEYEIHGKTWGGSQIGYYVWFHKPGQEGQASGCATTALAICYAALHAMEAA